MLSFFSSQGQFCMSYSLMLSELQQESSKILQSEEESFAGFTLQTLQTRAICQPLPSLLTALKAFQAKIKKKTLFHFTFNSIWHSYTYDSTVFIDLFNETVHKLFSVVCDDLIWLPITCRSFCSTGGQ